MNTQPEALRLAIQLEREWVNDALNYDTAQDAWTELRSLHALNQELVEALQTTLDNLIEWGSCASLYEREKYGLQGDILMAKAALAKASGTATQTGETE